MYGYVYLTTNLINGKKYIGKHKSTKFDKTYKGSGKLLRVAFDKYGWDNFSCEILRECESEEELNLAEIEIISRNDALNSEEYYNLTAGGTGGDTGSNGRQFHTPSSDARRDEVLMERYGTTNPYLAHPGAVERRKETCKRNKSGIYSRKAFENRSGAYLYNGKVYYGQTELHKAMVEDGYELTYSQVHHLTSGGVSQKTLSKYPNIKTLIKRIERR